MSIRDIASTSRTTEIINDEETKANIDLINDIDRLLLSIPKIGTINLNINLKNTTMFISDISELINTNHFTIVDLENIYDLLINRRNMLHNFSSFEQERIEKWLDTQQDIKLEENNLLDTELFTYLSTSLNDLFSINSHNYVILTEDYIFKKYVKKQKDILLDIINNNQNTYDFKKQSIDIFLKKLNSELEEYKLLKRTKDKSSDLTGTKTLSEFLYGKSQDQEEEIIKLYNEISNLEFESDGDTMEEPENQETRREEIFNNFKRLRRAEDDINQSLSNNNDGLQPVKLIDKYIKYPFSIYTKKLASLWNKIVDYFRKYLLNRKMKNDFNKAISNVKDSNKHDVQFREKIKDISPAYNIKSLIDSLDEVASSQVYKRTGDDNALDLSKNLQSIKFSNSNLQNIYQLFSNYHNTKERFGDLEEGEFYINALKEALIAILKGCDRYIIYEKLLNLANIHIEQGHNKDIIDQKLLNLANIQGRYSEDTINKYLLSLQSIQREVISKHQQTRPHPLFNKDNPEFNFNDILLKTNPNKNAFVNSSVEGYVSFLPLNKEEIYNYKEYSDTKMKDIELFLSIQNNQLLGLNHLLSPKLRYDKFQTIEALIAFIKDKNNTQSKKEEVIERLEDGISCIKKSIEKEIKLLTYYPHQEEVENIKEIHRLIGNVLYDQLSYYSYQNVIEEVKEIISNIAYDNVSNPIFNKYIDIKSVYNVYSTIYDLNRELYSVKYNLQRGRIYKYLNKEEQLRIVSLSSSPTYEVYKKNISKLRRSKSYGDIDNSELDLDSLLISFVTTHNNDFKQKREVTFGAVKERIYAISEDEEVDYSEESQENLEQGSQRIVDSSINYSQHNTMASIKGCIKLNEDRRRIDVGFSDKFITSNSNADKLFDNRFSTQTANEVFRNIHTKSLPVEKFRGL